MSLACTRSNCGLCNICRTTPGRRGTMLEASGRSGRRPTLALKGNTQQNTRIRILLEQDAFARIYENWNRSAFRSASGAVARHRDRLLRRPAGGARRADGDHRMAAFGCRPPRSSSCGSPRARPMRPISAPSSHPSASCRPKSRTVQRALTGVVTNGTARRITRLYRADGRSSVGGKTGTGDNRFERFSAGRGADLVEGGQPHRHLRVLSRRPLLRHGYRLCGRDDADRFDFTSAIAVQFLKSSNPNWGR